MLPVLPANNQSPLSGLIKGLSLGIEKAAPTITEMLMTHARVKKAQESVGGLVDDPIFKSLIATTGGDVSKAVDAYKNLKMAQIYGSYNPSDMQQSGVEQFREGN